MIISHYFHLYNFRKVQWPLYKKLTPRIFWHLWYLIFPAWSQNSSQALCCYCRKEDPKGARLWFEFTLIKYLVGTIWPLTRKIIRMNFKKFTYIVRIPCEELHGLLILLGSCQQKTTVHIGHGYWDQPELDFFKQLIWYKKLWNIRKMWTYNKTYKSYLDRKRKWTHGFNHSWYG